MDFKSLQKLRFFLAAAFPGLGRQLQPSAKMRQWLERHPRLKARLERIHESRITAGLRQLNETFVSGDYATDRLDWSQLPPESVGPLRGGVMLAGLLCLLVPVAMMVAWPPLPLETISGVAGEPVAGWSVVLWMVAAAVGWACLLVGTAAANRVAFPPCVAVFIYFNTAMSAALPRSWWGAALLVITAIAIIFGEARAVARAPTTAWRGIATCVLTGMMAGFVGIATTPVGALFKGHVLRTGMSVGVPLGLLLWYGARRCARQPGVASGQTPAWLRTDAVVAVIAMLHLAYTISLAVRGGLIVPAQGLQTVAVQATGYLWPLYYLIGVGVVFKVLRQTKLIHGAVREFVPGPVLVPLGMVFLALATAVAWSDFVVLQPGLPWPPGVMRVADWTHGVTSWMWNRPLWGWTMEWMRWVFLVVLALGVWAAVRRRLDGGMMAMLLFPTVLLWFAIFEYFFEFSGFGRTPMHTATSLLTFSIFILWLSHMALRQFLSGESPWWPRPARVIVYCAGLMFVLMPVHARAAMHDTKLSNEIFLYLFSGIIDLGLPYYLLVYAERHFQRLPFSAKGLLGFFGLGAALSVPFTILDKLAVSGWSLEAVWATASAQIEAILQGDRTVAVVPFLPPGWIIVRTLLAMGVVLVVGIMVRRRMAGRELAPAATLFAVIAVATGLACFANRALELPLLPPRVLQLITPMRVSQVLDVALVARYLSFVLPALVLGLALTGRTSRWRRTSGIAVAVGVHLGITWMWPAQEPWLRSTGVLGMTGAVGVLSLLVLVVVVRDHLDTVLLAREKTGGAARMLSPRELLVVGCIGLVGLAVVATWQSREKRMVSRRIFDPVVVIELPAIWKASPAGEGLAIFTAPSHASMPPVLSIGIRACESGNTRAVLQAVADEGAQQLAGFSLLGLEGWDQFQPGAVALEFQYERQWQNVTVPVMGTVVVASVRPDAALVFMAFFALDDRDRRWDIARALQRFQR